MVTQHRGSTSSCRALTWAENTAYDHWYYQRGVTLDFSRPGKPTDNAFIEAFNSKLVSIRRGPPCVGR